MECPKCGQEVHTPDGTLDNHLDPNTLEQCTGKAPTAKSETKSEAKDSDKAPAKKATPKKK